MDKLRTFKNGGNDLANILEEVMEDHDPESSDVLRIVFELMLDRHWNEIKKELEFHIEILGEIATWQDVIDMVEEAQNAETETQTVLELFKKRHWQGCREAIDFVTDLLADPKRTLIPKG
jgi:hypothetical protein